MAEPDSPRAGVKPVLARSSSEAADLIQAQEISSRELTELVLARIAAVDPEINAIVELRRDAALHEAEAADEATARRQSLGPLHGVPITVKEAFNVAGMRTTWGDPAAAEYRPDADAVVVQRLRQAGAIVVGKTNVAYQLADFAQSANDLYGVTNNPWDVTRTPGGSSGGSAAAISAGMSFLEYGSDLAGSLRIPATFCGVYTLRPTSGTVPLDGFQPPYSLGAPPDLSQLSALGPMARSAGDLRTALRVSGRPEGRQSDAPPCTLAPPRKRRLADFHVGVVLDDPHAPVTGEVARLLSDTVDAVTRAGAAVVEGWPAGVDPARDAETFGFHVGLFFSAFEPDQEFAPPEVIGAQQERRLAARAAWSRYFEDVDVFLCPANFTAAFPHDPRPFENRTVTTPEGERPYDQQAFWISAASLSGLPAVVAPVGLTTSGLPVGCQILAARGEDDTAITYAELLADIVGGYLAPPL